MNYSEAIQFLYELRLFGLKFGLENTLHLAALAGRPQDKLRFIHVAGTNGKGSTCAMLESIYRAAGLRVGLFTSPHLVTFAERIQVNRQCIAPEDVARLVEELRAAPVFSGGGEACPTFFEAVTVMALKYFTEQRCDLVVWETGLGGRLDATNIVTPLASIITNVQLDHQHWLGETLPEIAREKAGIIKESVPIITGTEDPAALEIITETARKYHAPLTVVTPSDAKAMDRYEIALAGDHQRMNAALAVKTAQVLNGQIPTTEPALRHALKETQWAGRWQIIRRDGQTVVLDGAHNPAAAQMLARAWQHEFAGKSASLILGIMRDKDGAAICKILAPLASKIFLAPIGSERSADPKSMVDHCRRANPAAQITVCQNLSDAFAKVGTEPLVLVTGSLYFVGEALEWLGLVPPSQERALNEYGAAPLGDSSIRAVTFDVGGTLIEPWPSIGDVYGQVAQRHGIQISPEVLNQRFAAAWKTRKNFGYNKSDWSELVDETFAGLATTRPSASFFPELYQQFAGAAAWRIYEDVRPCLDRLRRCGIKLGAISNWDERLRPLLKALALDRYFDAIVISNEESGRKPGAEIFRAAASQLKTPPQAILHIGDSRVEDFEGARAAGFQALLLTRGRAAGKGESIASLDQVPLPVTWN